MRKIPIGQIENLGDSVVRAMVGEGLHEDLRQAPSEMQSSDGRNDFLAHRMKNDVEHTWQIFREDFAVLSELSKTDLGHLITTKK